MSKHYSNSYIQSFAKCPLAGHYQYDLHLQPREGSTEHHKNFGKAMHEGWKILYTTHDVAEAKAAIKHYYPKQIDTADFAKTADNGAFTIDAYIKEYGWDKDWKVLAVENMDMTEDDYVVKLDLVVEEVRTGNILGVDHKFTGRYLNADFFNEFNPNSQVTQYYRYVKEKFGRCDGFIVNAVGMRYRQRAYKGEPAGFWCAFERLVLNRTEQQIAQDQESKAYWIERIEKSRESGVWGMNTSSCRFCSYRQACAAGWDWENDSELILTHYRQACDKWVPELEGHCQLDLDHTGEHSLDMEVEAELVVEV